FRTRLHARAQTLDIRERQKILRLVANEIVVGRDTITIRHSIPVPDADPEPTGGPRPLPDPSRPKSGLGYLLRSGSHQSVARQSLSALRIRFLDAAAFSGPPIRAVCGRCHRPLPNRARSAGGAGGYPWALCAVPSGASSREDSDCLLQ